MSRARIGALTISQRDRITGSIDPLRVATLKGSRRSVADLGISYREIIMAGGRSSEEAAAIEEEIESVARAQALLT